MKNDLNILIPDGESTWAINVIQCIGEYSQFNIHVLSRRKKTAAKYSSFIKSFTFHDLRDKNNPWIDILIREIKEKQIDVILPIAEPEISFLIKNKQLFEGETKIVALPSFNDFEISISKIKLYKFLVEHEIPAPESKVINKNINLNDQLVDLQFPLLIKPLNERGGKGIIRFETLDNIIEYIKNEPEPENYIIQQFVEGYDIDCSVLCQNGKILTYTIQKGFISDKNPYAPQLGVEFVKDEKVLNVVSELTKKLNWSGVAHCDLRFDTKDGTNKVLELNARYWGSLESSKKVGINFPKLAIENALGETINQLSYKTEKVVLFRGLLKLIGQKPLTIFKFKFLFQHSNIKELFKDPLPTLFRFKNWFVRKLGVNK